MRAVLALAPLLGLGLLLSACGHDDPSDAPEPGPQVGQEVFLTYEAPEFAAFGHRVDRTKEEARALAEQLHARVVAGEDAGPIARDYSNAPGAAADGFSGRLPHDAAHPDARDRAIAATRVGGITPIVDWKGGWWFAKRVDLETGKRLERLFLEVGRRRVAVSAIALLYRTAWIPDAEAREQVKRTKEEAVKLATGILRQLQAGGSFEDMARADSEDKDSAERGGAIVLPGDDAKPTKWLRLQDPRVPHSVLEAAWETPVGQVHPRVIVSPRGVFLVRCDGKQGAE
jgi:PPIC-type PPIASE domain